MYVFFIQIQVSIDSDNGLVPNRRPAIIWTNGRPVYWLIGYIRQSASVGQPTEIYISNMHKVTCAHTVKLSSVLKLI